ncbi:hypothetical protein ABTW96_33670 [Nocardia beijingensis]|uniref:hypothetical protein n=1 Tax=Nocardia beijingensis TaxID=95162 RepID=UPI00333136AB
MMGRQFRAAVESGDLDAVEGLLAENVVLDRGTAAAGGHPSVATAVAEFRWVTVFLGPWLLHRFRGRSSGDCRVVKRPQLTPVVAIGDAAVSQ